eukprot:scaffold98339_cov25-Prasinocladus_malaysianus.AAC.1
MSRNKGGESVHACIHYLAGGCVREGPQGVGSRVVGGGLHPAGAGHVAGDDGLTKTSSHKAGHEIDNQQTHRCLLCHYK